MIYLMQNKEFMKVNSTEWWHSCSAIWRFMPGEDKKTIADISQDLHWLSNAGFQAIQITAPYESAGFHPWWGLRVYDYFSINNEGESYYEEKNLCNAAGSGNGIWRFCLRDLR